MSARGSFADYRAAMAAAGFHPSSALGQNFLLDPTLHRWLAEQAAAGAGDTVLEIGVGLGFLTRELAALGARVVGVEVDRRLLAIVGDELRAAGDVALVHADALGGPGRTLPAAVVEALGGGAADGRDLVVCANLPYSVSGPLLAELVAMAPLPRRCVLLLQKEMAARAAAGAGSADYGSLSALVQSVFTAQVLRDVPPDVFRPRPKVMSAVLRLDRRPDLGEALESSAARRSFAAFVRALFQQRRKVLRATLPMACAVLGVPPPLDPGQDLGQRAEVLTPDALVALWRTCRR